MSAGWGGLETGPAADGKQIDRSRVCGLDRKIIQGYPGKSLVGANSAPDDEGESGEEPFRQPCRDPVTEPQWIDAHNSPDSREAGFVIGERFASGRDAEHLDVMKVRREELVQFLRFVFANVERVFAITECRVGCRDEGGAIRLEMTRESR